MQYLHMLSRGSLKTRASLSGLVLPVLKTKAFVL